MSISQFASCYLLIRNSARAATLHQFTIDALDIWIPATGLGLTNINDGVLGIFGYPLHHHFFKIH